MVSSYLEKLQNEYLEEKLNIEKELNNLQIQMKENIEFIKLLEEAPDSSFESFTPRAVNPQNKNKIQSLKDDQKVLSEKIEEERKKYSLCVSKMDELSSIIKVAKKTMIKKNKIVPIDDEIYRLTLLEMQENERQRISRELHDSTVQNLTSLVHKAELCSKLVDLDSVRCKLELTMMSKTLREIINETRHMIYNLRPMSFDDIGLHETIERSIENLENNESKKINFSVIGEPYQIKPVIGITLLRIIQEACSNAIRHARPSLIQVILKYEKDKIIVQIEDDGIGFNYVDSNIEVRADNSGFGLSMMKERVYLLSGSININSKVNCGTKITVEVPNGMKED